MLTLFSCPKAFYGEIKTVQRNAIESWRLLKPNPEIILIGDEEGTFDICKEMGLGYVEKVRRNEYGTPLVSSLFAEGERAAGYPILCYVNADVVLLSDFLPTIKRALAWNEKFLMVGRRWRGKGNENLNLRDGNWEKELRRNLLEEGKLDAPTGIDYFIYRKGLWEDIPDFALGRSWWDNWLVFKALTNGIPVINATSIITAVHQFHDYSHIGNKKERLGKGPELRRNRLLAGGYSKRFTVWDASHIITSAGIKRAGIIYKIGASISRLEGYTSYIVIEAFHPYSYPLFFLGKVAKRSFRILLSIIITMIHRIMGIISQEKQ